MSEKEMRDIVEGAGGKVTSVSGPLSDGSGFATASFPLPKDHWLTRPGHEAPPMGLRCVDPELRKELEKIIWAAGRHAVRGATMNGEVIDFDPDALCQNLVVGLLGYFTEDGLSHEPDCPEFDPDPSPSLVTKIVREPWRSPR